MNVKTISIASFAILALTVVVGAGPARGQISGQLPGFVRLNTSASNAPQQGHSSIDGTSKSKAVVASTDNVQPRFSIEARTLSVYDHPTIGAAEGNGYAYLLTSGENVFGHSFIWNRSAPMRFGGESALGTGYVEFARFDQNGNFGIGVQNPGAKLAVGGSASISGSLSIGSSLTAGGVANLSTLNVSNNCSMFGNRIEFTQTTTGPSIFVRSSTTPILYMGPRANLANEGIIGVLQTGGALVRAGAYYESGTNRGILFGDVKNFVEPSKSDPSKDYWYASLEGPEAAMYVRGHARLVDGKATVTLPRHFVDMMARDSETVILTPRSSESLGLAAGELSNGSFTVRELGGGHGQYRFDWEVKVVREGYQDFRPVRDWTDRVASGANLSQAWMDRMADLKTRGIAIDPRP